ncbi:MAG: tripartite tricarboxylate transporter substrate binding protein, partial [Betaproteobacteria bacterium]|nr:tripartite tricarboxylate transporter substrate binding protein [Betaproteobacteria bacterium]
MPFTFNSHAKTRSLTRWLLTIGVPLALSLAMGAVQAQTWPTKTVKIVVP